MDWKSSRAFFAMPKGVLARVARLYNIPKFRNMYNNDPKIYQSAIK
jgi:hypothetical protein